MQKLKSRKLWICLFVTFLIILNKTLSLGFDQETIKSIISLALAYIGGESIADAAGAFFVYPKKGNE